MPKGKLLSFENKEEYERIKREIATYIKLSGLYKFDPSFGAIFLKPTLTELSDMYNIHENLAINLLVDIGFNVGLQ